MFKKEIYIRRRQKLTEGLQKGIVLLPGNVDSPMNYTDNTYPFRQDSNFLYFFGIDSPGLAGVIDVDSGEEFIFGNDADVNDVIWMGPQESTQEKAFSTGVAHAQPFGKLKEMLAAALEKRRTVHFLPPYRSENKILLQALLGIDPTRLDQYASSELIRCVVALRSVKEACEVEEMKKAWELGCQMQLTAMQMARPGVWEQSIAGTIDSIPMRRGGRPAYPTILSQHGEILHNHAHLNYLQEGKLLLVDAGAESPSHYASDFTRTSPVGGKFNSQQREVYKIVLNANNLATSMTRAGVTYLSVHLAVARLIAEQLTALGLMKGNVDEAVQNGAHALFMPHGLGHMIGLDVHDMEDLGQIHVGFDAEVRPSRQFGTASLRLGKKLQAGYTLTNEPGIYFIPALIDKWKHEKINEDFINFGELDAYRDFGGIRLEDNLLVTENGSELLGARLPITPEEVEEAMNTGSSLS